MIFYVVFVIKLDELFIFWLGSKTKQKTQQSLKIRTRDPARDTFWGTILLALRG